MVLPDLLTGLLWAELPVPCDGWMLLLPERPCDWPASYSTLVCCPGCGWRLVMLCPSCVGLQLIRAWDDRSGIMPAFCRPCGRLPVSVPFDVFPLGSTTLER